MLGEAEPPGIVLTEADGSSPIRSRSATRHHSPSVSHNRSQSVRNPRRPHRFRHRISSIPNELTLSSDSNQSLPLPGDESDYLRLRNFALTPKGIVNRGDSFRSKSRSAQSVASVGKASTAEETKPDYPAAVAATSAADCDADELETIETTSKDRHRVLVVGAGDVGKTALTSQFMTSEYKCAYDISQDDDNEKFVAVILNGCESELSFFEHQFTSGSSMVTGEWDAYLVVYSVTSKRSLQVAKEILRVIHNSSKAVILVGNKTDLARNRQLSTDDGRALAIEFGSKFIETSAGINHQIDELLVGILSQIRLKNSCSSPEKSPLHKSLSLVSGTKIRKGKAKGLLKRILRKTCTNKSKSCDNLHAL